MNTKSTEGGQPDPMHPIAKRLEVVRRERGHDQLKEFWEALIERRSPGDSFSVSYSAVRYYHSTREPPVTYLARVADVMGVRLEWLATGEGPIADDEFGALDAGDDALADLLLEFSPLRTLPAPDVVVLWKRVLYEYTAAWREAWYDTAEDPEDVDEVPQIEDAAEKLAAQLFEPLRFWKVEGMSAPDLDRYLRGMLGTLESIIPGRRLDHYQVVEISNE